MVKPKDANALLTRAVRVAKVKLNFTFLKGFRFNSLPEETRKITKCF